MEDTFCFHVLLLEEERTRVTTKLPTPIFQPWASSTELLGSFSHIFLLSCVLHLACSFELPHWREHSLKKWPAICGCTHFFWPLLDLDNQHQHSNIPEVQLLGLQNCCSIALKQLWNGFLVFIGSEDSLITRYSRHMNSFLWVFLL